MVLLGKWPDKGMKDNEREDRNGFCFIVVMICLVCLRRVSARSLSSLVLDGGCRPVVVDGDLSVAENEG